MSEAATRGRRAAVRVLVVDDHVLYRKGLQVVIGHTPGIEIVGEACDGDQAVTMARDLAPDVVVMDLKMPRRSGISAAQRIRSRVPEAKILVLTMSDDEEDLFAAIKAGAAGYLLKDAPGEQVAESILAVHDGVSLIPPSMASTLLAEFAEMSRRICEPTAPELPRLTEREMQVLRHIAHGRSNRDIAKALFISENTVKNHVGNLLDKLHLHSRTEAAIFAVREKLVDIEV